MEAHPHGSAFHLTAWKQVIENVFGYTPHYYVLTDENDKIRGILPLFLIKTPLLGGKLISLPFAVYAGILADGSTEKSELVEFAAKLGKQLGVKYIELRNRFEDQTCGLPRIDRYVTFQFSAKDTPEELIEALPRKSRNMTRKVLKMPYSSRILNNGLGRFYELYSINLRRLGTPVFPEKHFHELLRCFGKLVDCREIVLDGTTVASSINLLFKGEMHTFYAASDQNFLQHSPNNFMYFDHMLWGARNGYPVFDYGRSRLDTGPYHFKRNMGAEPVPLPYEVLLVNQRELPNLSPANPRFNLAIRIWQRLPLAVTRWIGPSLLRFFP